MIEAEELISLINSHNGKPLYPAQLFSMCTLNVIASIIFGERLSQTNEKLNEYARVTHMLLTSKVHFINYIPLLRFIPHFKKILQEAYGYRRAQLKFIEEGIERSLASSDDSVTKQFAERQGSGFDRPELCHLLADLLVAGSETTATSLQWAMVLMANNQPIQERIRKDVYSAVGSRPVSLGDMINMSYVEAAILELMRVKTIVPLALLHLTLEDTSWRVFYTEGHNGKNFITKH